MQRTVVRSRPAAVWRDAVVVGVANGLVGATFGAIAVSSGLAWWVPVLASVVVFAGAAQFILVALLAAGADVVAAVAAALLVNARLLPLSFAAADDLGRSRRRRLLGAHLVTDETVAFARTRGGPTAFRAMGVSLFVLWNLGTVAGVLAARRVGDVDALGLDAAFPAALLVLVLPTLQGAAVRTTALAGCALAVLSTPLLPAGLPVVVALLAVVPAAVQAVRTHRREVVR